MTSAASNSPEFSKRSEDRQDSNSNETSLQRPKLVSPPRRPQKPPEEKSAPPVEEPAPQQPPKADAETDSPPTPEAAPESLSRFHPIAPPSEPMQYRAIGMVRGTYTPDEDDQLNRGHIVTDDDCRVEAVLLGRVTSLVKNHLDLSMPHLWVVYPRTRQIDREGTQELHLQIVGVWEPETLGLPGEESTPSPEAENAETTETTEAETSNPEENPESAEATTSVADQPSEPQAAEAVPNVNDNYFSIRGEVQKYEEDNQLVTIKILQNPRRGTTTRKAFRLTLLGKLEGRTVGYFWDLDVKREGSHLLIEGGKPIGIVPPKKRRKGSKGKPKRNGGPRRPGGSPRPRPRRPGDREGSKVVIKRGSQGS